MSAYSTVKITRSKAKAEWLKHLMNNPRDEELEEFMDGVLDEMLYNCRIVNDGEPNDDALI